TSHRPIPKESLRKILGNEIFSLLEESGLIKKDKKQKGYRPAEAIYRILEYLHNYPGLLDFMLNNNPNHRSSQDDSSQTRGFFGNLDSRERDSRLKGIKEGKIKVKPIEEFNKYTVRLGERNIRFYLEDTDERAPPLIYSNQDLAEIYFTPVAYKKILENFNKEELPVVLAVIALHEYIETEEKSHLKAISIQEEVKGYERVKTRLEQLQNSKGNPSQVDVSGDILRSSYSIRDIKKFLSDIQEDFHCHLQELYPEQYPGLCALSSTALAKLLDKKFGFSKEEMQVVYGLKKDPSGFEDVEHIWLVIKTVEGELFVDATFAQFDKEYSEKIICAPYDETLESLGLKEDR
ncbi:MAG: hypothetical protein N2Z79_01275, partial [Candidatus Omnitrophica bacterium]|nr:hypothetical protein [Candidatus Omnitrophota bacterium]